MPLVDLEFAPLRDPRLAPLATSAWPVWLWSADGSRILWANAVGAAIFGAAHIGDFAERRFKANDTTAAQVVRLGATLPSRAQERLERLRAFGAGFGRALTCVCSRIVLDDGRAAVLIVAAEAAGPTLTLGERVRRLFADGDATAAFGPDGVLVYASAAARSELKGAKTLSALGLADLAVPETGSVAARAQISGAAVDVTAEQLGKDNSRVLLLTLPAQPVQPAEAAPVAAAPEIVTPPPAPPVAESYRRSRRRCAAARTRPGAGRGSTRRAAKCRSQNRRRILLKTCLLKTCSSRSNPRRHRPSSPRSPPHHLSSAVILCASSGTWMPTGALWSARTNSSN